ncbi:MAG: hypothetical protein ACKO2P_00870 [Planctomycetota bacterium]
MVIVRNSLHPFPNPKTRLLPQKSAAILSGWHALCGYNTRTAIAASSAVGR